ncbi:arginase family protein [Lysinibacillus sp. NPDC097195]|uniref:arginase family protein n=1 Tax=Lysinibacillus sp. NPDC097195 TaxID=3364141 RepID=UPI0037FAD0E9
METTEKKYKVRYGNSKILLTNETNTSFWEFEDTYHAENTDKEERNFFTSVDKAFFSYPLKKFGNVHLFGFPFNKGSNKSDSKVKNFAAALRESSLRLPIYLDEYNEDTSGIYDYLRDKYLMKNCFLVDHGDLSIDNDSLEEANHQIFQVLNYIESQKTKFCVVGGDHSITYTLVRNLTKILSKRILVIQFDAHHDCGSDILKMDKEICHSNFVRFLLKEELVTGIIQIGVRGLRSLGQYYNHPKLFQLNFSDLNKLHSIVSELLHTGGEIIGYVSFDVDVLEPRDFPLVDFPKIEGPKLQEVIHMIQGIFKIIPFIKAVDIVEGQSGGEPEQYDSVLHILLYLLEGLTNKGDGK